MNLLKKSVLLLLTLSLLISFLFSCQTKNEEQPSSETSTEEASSEPFVESSSREISSAEPSAESSLEESQFSTEPATQETPPEDVPPESPSIILSDSDGSYYTVVRPATSTADLNELMQNVMQFPMANGARSLNLSWMGDGKDVKGPEILVGYTNRPESREVMESIGYDDFAIVAKGDKIVIAAHSYERLREAVNYLCENLLTIVTDDSGKKSFVYLNDYIYVSEQNNFFFNSENALTDYSIVYRESSEILKEAAEKFNACLKEAYGIELPVKSDSSPKGEKEILLGKNNRELSQKYFSGSTNALDFSSWIVTEGDQLLIGSASDTSTALAVERFCETYVKKIYSYTFNLAGDTVLLDTGYEFSESPELAEGAEMRIMSFNILCELWDAKAKDVESRMKIVMATLLTYSPEVVGLQEVSDKCYQSLNPLFEGHYAFVDTKTEKGRTNFSPLAYNVEKVTLLEHGVKTLASGNNPSLRVISWGYFERKSDGERFLVANTHWDLTAMPESRTKQAIEMGDFMVSMKEKYNCPVISTGDYNTQSHQEQFQTYLDHSKLSDAGLTANVINRNYKSTHDLFEEQVPAPDILAIDHIFYSSDIEALYYNMLIDKAVIDASDHFPVYADIRFKK